MTVTFLIPSALRSMTGAPSRVEVATSGGTLGEAFEALCSAHAAVRDRVITEQGEIREHVNVFVGNSSARFAGGLSTPIVDGVEISIIPAISGG